MRVNIILMTTLPYRFTVLPSRMSSNIKDGNKQGESYCRGHARGVHSSGIERRPLARRAGLSSLGRLYYRKERGVRNEGLLCSRLEIFKIDTL